MAQLAKPQSVEPTPEPKVKQSTEDKLNKTESQYLRMLQLTHKGPIRIQDITIRLGDNLRYTPDFYTDDDNTMHEVKGGFFREDARAKLLAAVRQYPCFRWILAQKTKGDWEITELKP